MNYELSGYILCVASKCTDSLALKIDPEVKEIFWVKLMEKKE